MSEEELRNIRNILTMNDEVRTELVYDKARYLKKKIISSCRRCSGSGMRYVDVNDSIKSYPCNCFREFTYKLDLLIAGVDEITAERIIAAEPDDTKVVELDIAVNRDGAEKFPKVMTAWLYRELIAPYVRNTELVTKGSMSYLFTGVNSTGKTFAALYILHAYLRKGYSGHYILFRELMKQINKWLTGDKDVRKHAELLVKEIFEVDMLVIDELGKEGGGREHVASELESLLKERDQRGKPSVLITNQSIEELIDRYTTDFSDFTSVFMKSYRVLLFNPKADFRKKSRSKWNLK